MGKGGMGTDTNAKLTRSLPPCTHSDVCLAPACHRLTPMQAAEEGPDFDIRHSDLNPELISVLEGLNLRGQLSHLVTPWNPWWETDAAAALQLNAAGQRVVQDLDQLHQQVHNQQQQQQQRLQQRRGGDGISRSVVSAAAAGAEGAEESAGLPQPPEEAIPTLQLLAGKGHKPSPLLLWQLLQLLVAYCAVLRQFNGDAEVEGGWEAAQLLLLLAPPLVQAALAGSSSSSSSRVTTSRVVTPNGSDAAGSPAQKAPETSSQADEAQQEQQEQERQQPVGIIVPPDSVRLACLQLLEAAAASDSAVASSSGVEQQLQEQLAATAAAVSAGSGSSVSLERRALLQVAEADALRLLQLGRSAVLLALTDMRRLLVWGKEQVKQAVQQQGGKGQQQQKQRRLLQQLRQGLGLAAQKVWYFMAWANEQGPGVYQMLADELGRELQGQQTMMSQPVTGVTLTGNPAALGVSRIEPVQQQQQPIVVLAEAANPASGADAGRPAAVKRVASGLYDLD